MVFLMRVPVIPLALNGGIFRLDSGCTYENIDQLEFYSVSLNPNVAFTRHSRTRANQYAYVVHPILYLGMWGL